MHKSQGRNRYMKNQGSIKNINSIIVDPKDVKVFINIFNKMEEATNKFLNKFKKNNNKHLKDIK